MLERLRSRWRPLALSCLKGKRILSICTIQFDGIVASRVPYWTIRVAPRTSALLRPIKIVIDLFVVIMEDITAVSRRIVPLLKLAMTIRDRDHRGRHNDIAILP